MSFSSPRQGHGAHPSGVHYFFEIDHRKFVLEVPELAYTLLGHGALSTG